MEVHHHPSSKAGENKKFKEYFLEFIMMFLAVTLGFFAENIREKTSDKRHVHEYIKSMVSDLKSDLLMFDSCKRFNTVSCAMIDSIIKSLQQARENTRSIYYLARRLTMGSSLITPNTKTFEQMKSTGEIRLIHDQKIAGAIASYYQLTRKFDFWSEQQRLRLNDVININEKIFDATIFFSIIEQVRKKDPGEIIASIATPKFMNRDPATVNAVIMRYQYYYGILTLNSERAEAGAQQAKGLMETIEKKYDLRDE